MINLLEIAELIQKKRKEKGYTQIELAELAGVSRGFIRRLENADFNDIGFMKILQVLNILDIKIKFEETEGPPTLIDIFNAREESRSKKKKSKFL